MIEVLGRFFRTDVGRMSVAVAQEEMDFIQKNFFSEYIQWPDEAGDTERPGTFAGIFFTLVNPRWMSFCCCL